MIYWILFIVYAALMILSLVSIFQVSTIVGVVCILFIAAGLILSFYARRFRQAWTIPQSKMSGINPDENK